MSSPSVLPSSTKHATFNEVLPATSSLSQSAKHGITKSHRHQVGGAHRLHPRNTSFGNPAGKTGNTTSAQNLLDEGARHHRKKPSIGSILSTTPRNPVIKRNNSHVALVKNTSQVHLRKNKSANTLARNLSHTQLHRKTGLGPSAPKPRKQASKKQKGFQLGEKSSDEELSDEEAEWEDSATQSPRLTRSNSAVSSQPAKPINSERTPAGGSSTTATLNDKTPSPPEPLLRQNRSAPNFGARTLSAFPARPPDPAINLTFLQYNPRSSRAPPAISSISAQASHDPLPHSNSAFTHINHADASSSHNAFLNTPNIGNSAGASSSADGGVSHFLTTQATPTLKHQRRTSFGSDSGSPSSFLPHYHPQQPSSPEKSRVNGPIGSPGSMTKVKRPSRTQQRLELQRVRTAGLTTPANPLIIGGRRGSGVSLHSRSGSHGRNQGTDPASAAAARLMIKQDYEAAERQLAVVRIFRNPVVEAVERLKEAGVLVLEKRSATLGGGGGGREQDRRKKGTIRKGVDHDQNAKSDAKLKVDRGPGSGGGGGGGVGSRSSFEEGDATSHMARPDQMSRFSSHGRPTQSGQVSAGAGKVRFQRQGSHDEIGLSRSQGSYNEDHDNNNNNNNNHSDDDDDNNNNNKNIKNNHNISCGGDDGEDHGHVNGDDDGDGGGGGGGDSGRGSKKGGRGEATMSAEEEMMRRMWAGGEVSVR